MKALSLVFIVFLFYFQATAQRVSSTHFFYFESSSYQLQPSEEKKLVALCDTLKQHQLVSVSVTGHTDDSGDEDDNLVLSEQRSKTVKNVLIQQGIPEAILSISSMGEANPIEPNTSEKRKAKNRRVEVKVVYD